MGYSDPASNLFDALKTDPAKEQLARLMEAWHDAFGSSSISVKEALNKAGNHPLLQEALLEVAEGRSDEIDRKKLGHYLKKSSGRPINGWVFRLDNSAIRSANQYRLVRLSNSAERTVLEEEIVLTNRGQVPPRSYSSYSSYSFKG